MTYCDTSLLVAALTSEPATERAQHWLRTQAEATLFISGWVVAEFAGALAMKVRMGALSLEARAGANELWHDFKSKASRELAISANAYEVAAQFAGQHELGLRTADAFHLAIASLAGHRIATLDRRMADAANKLAVAAVLV